MTFKEKSRVSMDFYEAVERRRTVRDFQSKPVKEEKLMRVLAAGLKAPTHNHLREWEFILIKDFEQREKVVAGAKGKDFSEEEVEKAISKMEEWERPAYLAALPVQKRMMLASPELLVVCFRMRKPFKECKTLYDLNNPASVWACVENILLARAGIVLCSSCFRYSRVCSLPSKTDSAFATYSSTGVSQYAPSFRKRS